MNILIQFEDDYGCYSLFRESNSLLNCNNDLSLNVDVTHGKSATGVFKIAKHRAKAYDYIILVFDLDSKDNYSLTGNELVQHLYPAVLFGDTLFEVREEFENKVILVPVFFCYETLVLFSKYLQGLLSDIASVESNETVRLLQLYKQYYDYSKDSPEDLHNICSVLPQIVDKVHSITGYGNSTAWLPQTFHASYAKSLLKFAYGDLTSNDKIFKKHEDQLFPLIKATKGRMYISDWLNELSSYTELNNGFATILNLKDIQDLRALTIEKVMSKICTQLNTYNCSIMGVDYTAVNKCRAIISEYLSQSNIPCEIVSLGDLQLLVHRGNPSEISKHCKGLGLNDTIIQQALRLEAINISS